MTATDGNLYLTLQACGTRYLVYHQEFQPC